MRAYTYDDTDVEDFDLTNWKLQAEDIQYKVILVFIIILLLNQFCFKDSIYPRGTCT